MLNYNHFNGGLENHLSKIPGTNVWFISHEIDARAICHYQFVANAPAHVHTGEQNALWKSDVPRPIGDSFNPHIPNNDFSILVLPQANNVPFLRDDKSATEYVASIEGTNRFKLYKSSNTQQLALSPALRQVAKEDDAELVTVVITPKNYRQNKTYPVVFAFDGPPTAFEVHLPYTLDTMTERGEIPEVVLVLVHYIIREDETSTPNEAMGRRFSELRLRLLRAEQHFAQYIAEQLLPFIQSNYRGSAKPEDIFLYGQSLGGLTSFYCAMQYPDRFGNVLSHSGSFWDHPIEGQTQGMLQELKQRENSPKATQFKQVNFVLTANEFEFELTENKKDLGAANKNLATYMEAHGYHVNYVVHPACGHDYAAWGLAFPSDFKALYAMRNKPANDNDCDITAPTPKPY